jgi:hypothetical protein
VARSALKVKGATNTVIKGRGEAMTLRDILNGISDIQGNIRIVSFDYDTDESETLFVGYNIYIAGDWLDKAVRYIYPDTDEDGGAVLVVEIEEEKS